MGIEVLCLCWCKLQLQGDDLLWQMTEESAAPPLIGLFCTLDNAKCKFTRRRYTRQLDLVHPAAAASICPAGHYSALNKHSSYQLSH